MPAVAFTDPELASVGMTIKDAKMLELKRKLTNSHSLEMVVHCLLVKQKDLYA